MEFYEEALSLCCDLTTRRVSQNMWRLLEVILAVFNTGDGADYFVEVSIKRDMLFRENNTYVRFNMKGLVFIVT